MNSNYFRGVQALRGLAALSVMLFHFRWNINATHPGLGDTLFGWGANGVDLFFLISGFVIVLTLRSTPQSLSGMLIFLQHRALRILPAYYIILLITFFLSGAMSTFHYEDKAQNFISALLFQPIYSDHSPFYVDDSGMYGIRWTLNYEVYFYLIVGLLLALPKRGLLILSWFALTLFLFPLVMGKTPSIAPQGYDFASAQLNLITNPMIVLFLVGMTIGLCAPALKKIDHKFMVLPFICLLVIAGVTFSQGRYVEHGLMGSGWVYALILLSAVAAEKHLGKWIPVWLLKLGDISFSLYLIHTLMNTGIGKRLASMGIEPGLLRFSVSVILSILLAWLAWRFIEKPCYSLRKKQVNAGAKTRTKVDSSIANH